MSSRDIFYRDDKAPRFFSKGELAYLGRRGPTPLGQDEGDPSKTDDMGMPVGGQGMRRFPTSKPGEGGGGPGSTSGVLLGLSGYRTWAKDMRERGERAPTWDEGTPYQPESLTPADIVERLIAEADDASFLEHFRYGVIDLNKREALSLHKTKEEAEAALAALGRDDRIQVHPVELDANGNARVTYINGDPSRRLSLRQKQAANPGHTKAKDVEQGFGVAMAPPPGVKLPSWGY